MIDNFANSIINAKRRDAESGKFDNFQKIYAHFIGSKLGPDLISRFIDASSKGIFF